jgi:hypothetical protein
MGLWSLEGGDDGRKLIPAEPSYRTDCILLAAGPCRKLCGLLWDSPPCHREWSVVTRRCFLRNGICGMPMSLKIRKFQRTDLRELLDTGEYRRTASGQGDQAAESSISWSMDMILSKA